MHKQHMSRPAMQWERDSLCYIDGRHIGREKGRMYRGKVLDWAFSHEGDYLQIKLEVTATVKSLNGQSISQTWVYPKPIQSYKLRKRVS